jgi:hypothetical protein
MRKKPRLPAHKQQIRRQTDKHLLESLSVGRLTPSREFIKFSDVGERAKFDKEW